MTLFIIFHDQNMTLKHYTKNHDRQSFNHSPIFLKYLIFSTLTLFTTLLRHSLTNQSSLWLSTSHNPQAGTLEPNLIYDHHRGNKTVSVSHHLPLRINNLFSKVESSKIAYRGWIKMKCCSSEACGIIQNKVFLVHHKLYLLHFAVEVLQFTLGRIYSLWKKSF